jgi:tripartite-type tricarboxylate transporter receptor subunit TctC
MSALSKFAIGGLLGAFALVAQAQAPAIGNGNTYPSKPVRIITGAAGSTVHDVATRHLSQRLSERWGQPIVVENQPAAALTIGAGIAARATPDGYTLLMSDRSALSIAPSLDKQLQYDPVKDLAPITQVAKLPSALVAHPSIPATTLREFVDYAKQQPDSINFASAGVGTAGHIANELFKSVSGINLVNIHYKGGGAAVLALMGGEVKPE